MADVFLSYSSKDRAAAEVVERSLSARGIEVFWDQETPAGTDWDTWIRGKLSSSRIAVVLWSRHSVGSDNVRHEALVARKSNKLLPVLIDALSPEDLPMGLYMVQSVVVHDWRSPDSKGIARLVAEIEARLGRTSSVAAAKSMSAPRSKFSPVGVAVGLLLVGAGSGVMWWANQPKTPPTNPAIGAAGAVEPAAGGCPGGASPVLGVCPSDPAATAAMPVAPPLGPTPPFSKKLIGHWRFDQNMLCTKGATVSSRDGQLIVSTPNELDFVHAIDSDTAAETRTHVLSPDNEKGHVYRFAQKPIQPNAPGGFILVVEDQTAQKHDEWNPCTVKQ